MLLKRGSRGPEVSKVQTRLLELGYNPGTVDGIFGPKTEAAVIQFQRDRGLTPDGIVGPVTYNALFSPSPQPGYILYTIKQGDTFYKLSLQFGVSLERILAANPGVDPNRLQIGQQIKIPQGTAPKYTVAAWIPYWKQLEAMTVIRRNPRLFTTLSPFWYELTVTGDLNVFPNGEDPSVIQFARNNGIQMIPLIANNFDSELISIVLNNPSIRRYHITQIVNKVNQTNYDGIEIDYENLLIEDSQLFVQFLRELKAALPASKELIVAVSAKTDPIGGWSGATALDYPGIGSIADVVRIMAYDFSWDSPGPIAPANWVRKVLEYAVSTIPRNKIEMGLPTYGYDWGMARTSVTWNMAMSNAQLFGAQIIEDPLNGPHYNYIDQSGIPHEVWFTNALNFGTLVNLVKEFNVRGIAVWHPGEDDPNIYNIIWAKLKS